MRFKVNKYRKMKDFKVSIRVSIITLFVILLSLIGFSIISIQYVALNKILSSSTIRLIDKSSLLVKERFRNYFLPLNTYLLEIKNMIHQDIIHPENREQFDKFLIESIDDNLELSMIYFATPKGNFYGVERGTNGKLYLDHIINFPKPSSRIRYEVGTQGNIVKTQWQKKDFDPRKRPWYQKAVKAGKVIWTDVYKFHGFQSGINADEQYGISSAAPIYDSKRRLKGVIGIDLTVNNLQRFIQSLQITKNTIIYIINENNQILAYRDMTRQDNLLGKRLSPELVKKLFSAFSSSGLYQGKTLVTSYQKNSQDYFLAYQPLTDHSKKVWHAIILVPSNDVLAPLKHLSLRSLLLTIFILFIGIIIVRYISQKISRPIIQLAREAKKIKKLELKPQPPLKTRIKEISYMDRSLTAVRSGLSSFERYVPKSLVKKLVKNGKIAEVGGKNQDITILFSDIKNFTALSEKTDPQQLMNYLSDYFQSMTEVILHSHGTLDKYIGDGIMALWNAPIFDAQHALHACQTAIEMMDKLKKLNKNNQKLGLPELTIRIGINSGEAIVGNVGSEERLGYTALGDAVNIASRLESINKIYHTHIIVSESTFKQVESFFAFRLLDKVAVRGKHESTTIYELILESHLPHLDQHKKEFSNAFAKYHSGQWKESMELFKKLTPAYEGDQLASVYIKRCQALINSPPVKWDGIWRTEYM
ncbi:adenylate/guanylate cyclase domain-containing protein [Legionella israelensis]|nr:adenylate/guanylate cyclase domain-containing protein [Legionella israelensis]